MVRYFLIGLMLSMVTGVAPARGETRDIDFDYDIFRLDDTLAVWLDLAPVMTQEQLEDLAAGLDISITITCTVEKPRAVLPARTILSRSCRVFLSHPLTEDIYRIRLYEGGVCREFKSQLALSDFLADSLVFRVAPVKQLRPATDIRLRLTIITKSHSPNMLDAAYRNRSGQTEADDQEGGIFQSAFSFFLDLVGFGRTAYRIVTPVFSVDELTSF